ncbi:MAG: glycosyltransferase [Bacteroidales bacterium]|nr:glycosyltransferase [Bacteroidales bacterium]
MRIMHLPASFLPYYTGGKEVFVAHLAEELQNMGHHCMVVIHHDDRIPSEIKEYSYRNIRVKVLPSVSVSHEQYWKNEATFDDSFEKTLIEFAPDVVHFHDQSGGASLSHLRIVKRLGYKTLLTYHSPGQSCPQRALLNRSKNLCDGRLDIQRCSECLYVCRGLPLIAAQLLSRAHFSFDNIETNALKRFFMLPKLVHNFIDSFHETYLLHEGIQVHAHWVKDVLKLNKVDKNKIYYAELTIPDNEIENKTGISFSGKLKLVFIGRCTYIKGVHILIEAIKKLPRNFPVEVHFLGPYWGDTAYGRKMLKKIRGDIRFRAPILLAPNEVVSYMRRMDAVVVPSLWPETGPFVVLEAFRAGVPVIGSRAAGIAQRVQHMENGLLFEWGNASELADCIQFFYEKKSKGESFTISKLPSIKQMTRQILEIYQQL